MNDVTSEVEAVVGRQRTVDKALEDIFTKFFEIEADANKENVGYQAWARSALVASIAIANVLLAIKSPETGRSFRAMKDLAYGLGANDFWQKNAPVLMPLLTVILNSHEDYMAMLAEQIMYKEYATYDRLMTGTQVMPLEIFSMILYLVGGPLLMTTSSLPLKMALTPYLVK